MVQDQEIKTTPLHALHLELGAKMVPFAGYDMPVQYPLGVLKEHLHVRQSAGLFDVSHMGQTILRGHEGVDIAALLEQLVPGSIQTLVEGGLRYTMFLNDNGGILDDLMVTRPENAENSLYLVVNAGCKEADFALIQKKIGNKCHMEILDDRALLALQGPKAVDVLEGIIPGVASLSFMRARNFTYEGQELYISRSGYTGEDGFEISIPGYKAPAFAKRLLGSSAVEAIGLGARDSLRLEAGLCLYGSDLIPETTPVEADLLFALGKVRRERKDFPGAERILAQIENGPDIKRVGIKPLGRAPARSHTGIVDLEGNLIGEITSGGFGPSANGPVAMGYVKSKFSEIGTALGLVIRGKVMEAEVVALPFVPHRYFRKPK